MGLSLTAFAYLLQILSSKRKLDSFSSEMQHINPIQEKPEHNFLTVFFDTPRLYFVNCFELINEK